ncbi:MAG: tetratricopeptide repeat protein, partial [Gammaproteobacteria bacterium]|nr:tetratricopeptide repeat protein [Gammaproteobacteria bacterium]
MFRGLFIAWVTVTLSMGGAVAAKPLADQPGAAVEAQLGIELYQKKEYQSALGHLIKAARLDPENEGYQIDTAILSEMAGQVTQALPYYHQATKLASKRKDFEAIQVYNLKIEKLASLVPGWAEEKQASFSMAPEAAARWQKAFDQFAAYVQQKKVKEAEEEGAKVFTLAEELFGKHHPTTLKTGQKWGVALFTAGAKQKGLSTLEQIEQDAVATFGAEHPEVQGIRVMLGQLLQEDGQYPQAENWYKKALDGFVEALGAGHPFALETSHRLATVEELQGKYGEAAQVLLNACAGADKVLGRFHHLTGVCFKQLGLMNFRMGDSVKSRFAYGRASKILRAVGGKGYPGYIQSQIYLADLARVGADFPEAERVLSRVIDSELTSDTLKFEAKAVMAQLFEDQGLYPEAEGETQAILQREVETLGEMHPNAITSLNNLAGLRRKQSRFFEAEKGYELALERFSQTAGEDHPSTIAVMNNLALTLENQGLYDRAEPLFRKALKSSAKVLGETHATTLANMNNLAMLHESQGLFDKAEPLYKTAIELLEGSAGDEHPDTLAVKNNLAYLYLLQEKNEEAAEIFEEVLELWQETLGESHQKTLKGMNNLGRVRHGLGELEEAEALISRALELRHEVLGENHIDTLRSQHDLAKLYMDLERYEDSETLLKKTLIQDEENLGEQPPYTFETLNTLAQLQRQTDQMEDAFHTQQQIFERRNKFLDQMLWATSENAREGYIRLHRPELYRYLSMVPTLESDAAGQELMRISLFRKGLLLQVASQIHQVAKLSDDPALTGISDELLATRKKLAALTLSGPTPDTATTFLETMNEMEDRINELEGELGRASIRFREAATDISLARLEDSLPDGSAVVDYMIFREQDESKLQVAILRKEEGESQYDHYLFEDLEGINAAIKEYRELIQDEDADDDEIMEFGMEVYTKVWAPIAEKLGEIENVYVVPDGMLNILPFNAMVTEDELYLLQAVDLHTISSSRDLIPSDVPLASGGYMIMAGPDYDTDEVTGKSVLASIKGKRSASAAQQSMRGMSHGMRGLNFDPLPGAEKEGRLIQEQTGKGEVVTRLIQKKKAQEKLLRSMEEPPEVLHIATHGFFLKPNEGL